ncbi:MAG: beta strand repeat-containing protein [Candidatus Melainabacteria bacterium]
MAGFFAACSLVLGAGLQMPVDALTVNAGETLTVESINGTPYVHSEAGDITINGILQGFDRVSSGGTGTGNGANITLTSTAGNIVVGPTGKIIINGTVVGGHGGTLILNGVNITINGIVSADGLGAGGRGGSVQVNGTTLTLGSNAVISALSGASSSQGGSVTINVSGLVTINSGAGISTKGESDATHNFITISGSGINLGGQLNTQSRGSTAGGKVTLTASSGTLSVTGSGSIIAAGNINNDGGTITLTGNVDNQGLVNASAGSGNRTGGVISITGTTAKTYSQSGSGKLLANGASNASGANGGSITVNTGTVTINQGISGVTVDASGSKLASGMGSGGSIDIRSKSGNLNLTNVDMQNYGAGGSIYLRSNSLDVSVGSGSFIRTFGGSSNTLDVVSGRHTTISGMLAAEGYGTGNAGLLTVNATNDFTLATTGYLSTRGSETDTTNTGSDGGTITVNAANIALVGNARMRAYGTQYFGGGSIGRGGVIDLNATSAYTSAPSVILNAGGIPITSGGSIIKNVIDISGATVTVDGRYMSHGRDNARDGGRISFTASNKLTLESTASLEAYGDLHLGGKGGAIYLASSANDVELKNGAALSATGISGSIGGLLNIQAASNLTLTSSVLDVQGGAGGSITASAGSALSYGGTQLLAQGSSGSGGSISMTSGGVMTVDGTATHNVSGTSNGVLSFTGSSVSNGVNLTTNNGTVNMVATTGNISNTADIDSSAFSMLALAGDVVSTGAHTGQVSSTAHNVSVTNSSGTLSIGNIGATAGNATLAATTGHISIGSGKTVSATNALSVTATNGNITTNGSLTGTSGGITLSATNGSITGTQGGYTGTLNASAQSVSLLATAGSMTLGDLSASSGNITINANSGGLLFSGGNTLSASGNMSLRAGSGGITAGATTTLSTPGTVDLSLSNDLSLTGNNSTLNTGNLNIYGAGGIATSAGNVSISKTSGSLSLTRLNSTGNNSLLATGAGSTLSLSNATVTGNLLMQADTSVTANSGNSFGGPIQIYGNSGAADYVTTVLLASTNGSADLNVTQLTATNATLTNTAGSAGIRLNALESNNGLITAVAGGDLLLTATTIDNTDTLRMTSNSNGLVTLSGNTLSTVQGSASMGTPTNGAYFQSTGAYSLAGNTIAGNLDVTSASTVAMTSGSVAGTTTASGTNINLVASAGDLALGASTASTGSVTATAQNGNLTTSGTLTATKGNVILRAQNGGDVTTAAAISTPKGLVSITSDSGSVSIGGNVDGFTGIGLYAQGAGGLLTVNNASLSSRYGGIGRKITLRSDSDMIFSGTSSVQLYGSTNQLGGWLDAVAVNGDITLGSSVSVNTYGLTDATHNRVNLTGNNVTVNGTLLGRGQNSGNGGNGGAYFLTSNTGDVTLGSGSLLNVAGYTYSDTRSGNGGSVTISAARDLLMDGVIQTNSIGNNLAQGLSGQNDGGAISITTGRHAVLNAHADDMFLLNGTSYTSGAFNGGNGGTLTITATNNIDFNNLYGAPTPRYISTVGGIGRGAGKTGGNGGNVNFFFGGAITTDNYDSLAPWNNFDIRGGAGAAGATAGTDGHVYDNGGLRF